jgi:hypothetical protein
LWDCPFKLPSLLRIEKYVHIKLYNLYVHLKPIIVQLFSERMFGKDWRELLGME